VVYSNQAKTDLVGVDASLIERFGAVSEEVAEALAEGALTRFGAEFGIGITGIAGPDGGTEEKPVGTVCFSIASDSGGRITVTSRLPGSRADIRDRSTTVALHLLRRLLVDDAPGGGAEAVEAARTDAGGTAEAEAGGAAEAVETAQADPRA
jgi:nicotinamide-nucleotide amidase